MPGQTSTRPEIAQRQGWIDVARGAAIVLVVLLHVQDALTGIGADVAAWGVLCDALSAVRMPLFFLVSGFLAQRAFDRPWTDVRAARVGRFLWMFAVWAGAYIAGYAAWAWLVGRPEGPLWWATDAAARDSTPWYLLALAVFFTIAWVTRRVPLAVQLAAQAVCSVGFGLGLVSTSVWMFDRMGHYALFFWLGARCGRLVLAWVAGANWTQAAAWTSAWLLGGAAVAVLAPRGSGVGATVLPFLALPAVLGVLGVVGEQAWTAPLAALGRRTLPVYVLHFAVVLAAVAVLSRTAPGGSWLVAYPLLLVPAVLAVSVAVGRALERAAPWLFTLPPRAA